MKLKFANECYTWFMKESGAKWNNQLEHMIKVTSEAGLEGIEPIFGWMGELSDPVRLKETLQKYNIELAAIAFGQPWNESSETEEEAKLANEAIELMKHFPDAYLLTVQLPTGRHDLEQRRLNLVSNINAVSRRAADAGVKCTFHPNSPPTSTNRTEEDYQVILEALDRQATGWTPDVGHIINGGMDPLTIMKKYQDLINLVHFKDWDGEPEFSLMGRGKVDFTGITKWLIERDFDGWVVCEDEAPQAVDDPDGVTLHDGKWIKEELIPSLK